MEKIDAESDPEDSVGLTNFGNCLNLTFSQYTGDFSWEGLGLLGRANQIYLKRKEVSD